MNCRSLWSHLDILIGRTEHVPRYPPSKLWIRCLQGDLLQVHIRQRDFYLLSRTSLFDQTRESGVTAHSDDSDSDDPESNPVDDTVLSLINFLTPFIQSVGSLEVICSQYCEDIFTRLMHSLGSASFTRPQVNTIRVVYDNRYQAVCLEGTAFSYWEHQYLSRHLTKLNLRNIDPRWSLLGLANLVELRLEGRGSGDYNMRIKLIKLTITLLSSPQLESLALHNVHVHSGYGIQEPLPVAMLKKLRFLSIQCTGDLLSGEEELEAIISLIAPGSYPLHLSLLLPRIYETSARRNVLAELRLFFDRSNVAVLHARAEIHSAWSGVWFASQLGPISSVHSIVLSDCHLTHACDSSNPVNRATLWPRLRTLRLISCGLEKVYFRQLMLQHDIQTLCLLRCYDETRLAPENNEKFQEECKVLVSDCVPSISVS